MKNKKKNEYSRTTVQKKNVEIKATFRLAAEKQKMK